MKEKERKERKKTRDNGEEIRIMALDGWVCRGGRRWYLGCFICTF